MSQDEALRRVVVFSVASPFQIYVVLLFGLPLAVTLFNRYSGSANGGFAAWLCLSLLLTSTISSGRLGISNGL